MKYEECYEKIVNKINDSILSKDESIKQKVFDCVMNWYFDNFDTVLRKAIDEDNYLRIENILKKINYICNKNDYEKLFLTYTTEEYEEFLKLNNEVFMKLYDYIINNKYDFNDNKYDNYIAKINKLGLKIPKILQNDFATAKSECLLDLLYLKNKGNISSYSFRAYNLLNLK